MLSIVTELFAWVCCCMHSTIDAQVIWLPASLLILSQYVQLQTPFPCQAPASDTIPCALEIQQYEMK